jgi:hypothetical protein
LEKKLNLQSRELDFKVYKRRWGCCYRNGKIVINPLIISAPQWVVDCVLVHELCHLQHMDHSKAFWSLNAIHCGKCNQAKQWLIQHQQAMMI